jgi:hypothetical protein
VPADESATDSSIEDLVINNETESVAPIVDDAGSPQGGLAAAIARSRAIKQELEKTPRQRAQEAGLKKI